MNTTIKLLDRYKELCLLPSDNQAALRLGVSRATVSAWRKGRNHAEPESVEMMAKAIGVDADEYVLRVQADREGAVNPKRAQVWLRCATRISGTAAGVALALGLAVYTPKTNAFDASYSHFTKPLPIYIMRTLRRLLTKQKRTLSRRKKGNLPWQSMRGNFAPAN